MDRLVMLRGRQQSGFGFKNKGKPAAIAKNDTTVGFCEVPTIEEIPQEPSRNDKMREMRASGLTFQSIADGFGVSTARVQQICKKDT